MAETPKRRASNLSARKGGRSLSDLDPKTVRLGVLGLVILAGFIFLIASVVGGDDNSKSLTTGPVSLSQSQLQDKAGSLPHVAYWLGPHADAQNYELTSTPDGRIYIRYLNNGAQAGDTRPDFLTVGTYAVGDAKISLKTAQGSGSGSLIKENGYEVLKGTSGQNVYVALDSQPKVQIEIFDPRPGKALGFATSGALTQLK